MVTKIKKILILFAIFLVLLQGVAAQAIEVELACDYTSSKYIRTQMSDDGCLEIVEAKEFGYQNCEECFEAKTYGKIIKTQGKVPRVNVVNLESEKEDIVVKVFNQSPRSKFRDGIDDICVEDCERDTINIIKTIPRTSTQKIYNFVIGCFN